jgi:hypothetical protein
VDYPLDARDAKRFGLAELQAAGLQVAVWDLSHFFHSRANELGIESPSWVDLTVCSSIGQFRDLCRTLTSEDVIIFIGGLHPSQVWRGRKILRLISTTPARLASISSGSMPAPILSNRPRSLFRTRFPRAFSLLTDPGRWKKVPQQLVSLTFIQAVTLQRRIPLRDSIRPLDHIWAGAMVSGKASFLVAPSTTITYIHTLDYDLVLPLRALGEHSTPRAVFIDSMGPLHPDYYVGHETSSRISIEAYSEMVCRALDEIEKRLGTDVVIAVHPRATPGVMEPWYGGRTLIYGQTPELIADATAVIVAEGSTAIGWATVFQRPLVLLSSSRFDSLIQRMNRAFAQALSRPLIDLDAPQLPTISLDVDERAYARYVEQYIKRPGTPEEPFWSVVASEINSGKKPLGGKTAG